LTRAAIPVMTIKGFALSLDAYRDLGSRPMADLDLVVPFRHVTQALEVLGQEGWRACPTPLGGTGTELATHTPWLQHPRPAGAFDPAYLLTRHGHGFRKDGDLEVDLHWFLFQGQCDPDTDDGAWQRARPLGEADRWGLDGSGAALVLPAAADHLLLLLSHGARWNPVPPIRWVADAVTLVQSAPGLDWERFLAEARRRRVVLPVREMLAYLQDTFDLSLPATVLARLREIPVEGRERRSHRLAVAPPGAGTALAELRYLGRRHRLLRRDPSFGRSVPGFGRYVCHVLGAPDLRALAGYGRRELLRRWRAPKPATGPSGPAL
jgi:hypothetical protein